MAKALSLNNKDVCPEGLCFSSLEQSAQRGKAWFVPSSLCYEYLFFISFEGQLLIVAGNYVSHEAC